MCISTIDWQGLGPTLNYRIAGGAQASLDDYARVLQMLASGGVGNGTRTLGGSAIATLNHSQTGNATLGYAPAAANGSTQYGIGAWIETDSISTNTPVIESIGAYGFTPWIDFGTTLLASSWWKTTTRPIRLPASTAAQLAGVRTPAWTQGAQQRRHLLGQPGLRQRFYRCFQTAPAAPMSCREQLSRLSECVLTVRVASVRLWGCIDPDGFGLAHYGGCVSV